MSFEYSIHVYRRLQERKIPLQVLEAVLGAPEQVLIQEDGTKVYQARIVAGNNKTYLLRAFVNDSAEPARVKSIYVTSKIRKYWSEQE